MDISMRKIGVLFKKDFTDFFKNMAVFVSCIIPVIFAVVYKYMLADMGVGALYLMNMILGLQKVLSAQNGDDKNAALLRALKPHLSEKRAGRVDNAIKIMKLIDLLPVLRESGVLGGLLG